MRADYSNEGKYRDHDARQAAFDAYAASKKNPQSNSPQNKNVELVRNLKSIVNQLLQNGMTHQAIDGLIKDAIQKVKEAVEYKILKDN